MKLSNYSYKSPDSKEFGNRQSTTKNLDQYLSGTQKSNNSFNTLEENKRFE